MSPRPDELARLLDRLDSELDAAAPATPESRARLHQLAQDIRQLSLDPSAAAPSPSIEHHSRLADFASRFEAGHPSIAAALRELADTLSKAGV